MAAKGPGSVLPLPDGIAAAFGLPDGPSVRLGGGYHNTLLRVGDVVVRIEDRPAGSVAWEHALLAWLAPELPEILEPLGCRVVDWEVNDRWDWTAIEERPPELVRAFEHARRRVASAPPPAVTPIHGDLAHRNVITRGGRVVALLDWEYARLDWPALELATAAVTYAEDDPQRFVAANVAAGGPGEPEALEEGRRLHVLANALDSLGRSASNRDSVEYLLARLRELP